MSPQADQQAAVVASYQQQTAAARAQLAAFITALWASLPQYRNDNIREFTGQALPVVQAAMGHMQALTAAYLATLNGAGSVAAYRAADITTVRNGASAADVYSRPFNLVWRRLHDLAPLDEAKIQSAIDSGQNRAVQTALTDLQLAKTHTAAGQMARSRNVVGYRRQLEGAHSCALCIVAATRRYRKTDLMPIHPACDCISVPIMAGEKANLNLDPALLEAAHATVANTFGADSTAARDIRGAFKANGDSVLYSDVLVTHNHGELGPVLAVRGQKFTGPHDIAA